MMQNAPLASFVKRHWFLLLVAMFLIYSAIDIYRTSFLIHGVRYFSLFDDEMISMRYAYNPAHGYGLVWNAGGKHIEGFTNLLWTLYMAAIHLLPIPLAKTSLIIQITGAFCIALTLYFVKQIAALVSNRSSYVMFLSVLFTAFYFPLFNWSVILGTEVSIMTLLLTWAALLSIQVIKTKAFSPYVFVLLGIGVLVRMDFLGWHSESCVNDR